MFLVWFLNEEFFHKGTRGLIFLCGVVENSLHPPYLGRITTLHNSNSWGHFNVLLPIWICGWTIWRWGVTGWGGPQVAGWSKVCKGPGDSSKELEIVRHSGWSCKGCSNQPEETGNELQCQWDVLTVLDWHSPIFLLKQVIKETMSVLKWWWPTWYSWQVGLTTANLICVPYPPPWTPLYYFPTNFCTPFSKVSPPWLVWNETVLWQSLA